MILVDSELPALPPKTEESSNTDEHSYPPHLTLLPLQLPVPAPWQGKTLPQSLRLPSALDPYQYFSLKTLNL
ncbi:hypothetical protein A0H81_06416 [Grifola frondosa]|uniref:Uncharacterized protein n=1 Tax=Grifola frondosa TaxID=5627 RepID=A0A1C7MC34_GRIFR|nr:hypothetical protein A0H81_06416 [Grifola frondosa]